MTTTYNPPSVFFNGINYNPSFYTSTNSSGISQSQADLRYLQKTGTPISTASLTTFKGSIEVDGTSTLYNCIATSSTDNTVVKIGANTCNGTASYALYNVGIGSNVLNKSTGTIGIGGANVGIGFQVMPNLTGGYNNLGIGFQALYSANSNSANNNVALGASSLYSLTSGQSNFALGTGSLYSLTTGVFNVAIGISALSSNNGSYNTAIGYNSQSVAGYNTASNNNNVSIGNQALQGYYNSGSNTGSAGNNNTCVGTFSLNTNNGSYNTAIGYRTLASFNNFSGSSASYNTVIGGSSNNSGNMNMTGGDNITLIGYGADVNTVGANYTNSVAIGNCLITGSNQVILGNSSQTTTIAGNLTVNGTTNIAGFVDTSTNQTVGGIKTFSSAPVMSGASITSGSIGQTQLSNGYVDLSSNQSIAGNKTFSNITTYTALSGDMLHALNGGVATQYFYINSGANIGYWNGSSVIWSISPAGSISATSITTNTAQINNENTFSCASLQTGNFTISAPFSQIYPVAPTANQTITFPTASATNLGVQFTIRRVGGTTTTTVSSASSNIYPSNSLTAGLALLASGAYSITVGCSYITASTYGWVVLV
jgi:hypothetical protein